MTALTRRSLARGAAWTAPIAVVAAASPAFAATCAEPGCAAQARLDALTDFGTELGGNSWTVGSPNGSTFYNNYTAAPPLSAASGLSFGTFTPPTKDCTSTSVAAGTTLNNAIYTGASVLTPATNTNTSCAVVTYTSAPICLGPGTYTLTYRWSSWRAGHRTVLFAPFVSVNGATATLIGTAADTTAANRCSIPYTQIAATSWGNPMNGTNCAGQASLYLSPNSSQSGADSRSFSIPGTLGGAVVQLILRWSYGPVNTCFYGCAGQANQIAVSDLKLTCG